MTRPKGDAYFRSILEATRDCIRIIDPDGCVEFMNEPGMALFEIDDFSRLKGRPWSTLWHPDTRDELERALDEARQGRTATFVAFCPTAKGAPRWWESVVSPVIGRNGRVVRILARSRDITERREASKALKAALARAEAASRAKSDFLANMSHEFRTPLNGVMGGVELLARAAPGDAIAEIVEMIRASGAELERLLTDVLDFARLQSDEVEIEREPFHLGEALRDAAHGFERRFAAKGLAFDVDVESTLERRVVGDRARLRQVLTILLGNALKFTEVGRVVVAAAPADESASWRISVTDTGVGFDPAEKGRIFGRFEQADSSSTRRFGGSGLGLAIASQLAAAMGGELDAVSQPGAGASFVLTLALPDAAEPRAAHPTELAEPGADEALKVLVVDDHPTNRRIVEMILGQCGVATAAAQDGAEAVAAFARERFDVILMDIQMPVMDGLAATRAIRDLERAQRLPRTPILMLTANVLPEHVRASRAAGADDHLAKPLQVGPLLSAIEDAVTRHRAVAPN